MMMDRLNPADHPWMVDAATKRVMAALEKAAPNGARFVGGCVRNALLGEPVADIDIATSLHPAEAKAAFEADGIAVHPTGLEHGTLTAVANCVPFEVTTLRRDVSPDGRRATVAFTTDWAQDAARRDFRINAIYADSGGQIFDPVGGLEDVAKRRFVFIGDAQTRIREDYLRILRFFRFFAHYGSGAPDAAGLAACAALQEGLTTLSAERVWMETKKLFAAQYPVGALRLMGASGIAETLYGQAGDLDRLSRGCELGAEGPVLRLGLFAGAASLDLINRLKLSNDEAKRLRCLFNPELSEASKIGWQTRAGLEKLVYRHGNQAVADQLYLLFSASEQPPEDWGGAIAHALSFAAPEFPLSGKDLKAAGLIPGPEMGNILKRLETDWVESRFRLSNAELLIRL